MGNIRAYDLKLGYSCNNHCLHCVVETARVVMANEKDGGVDQTYTELIECINSEDFASANAVVITGGEPTVRKEFLRIIKYIVDKYPNKKINIQTNGRYLKRFVQELHDYTDKIFYVVAIHGTEEIHNKITGNRNGNPFKDTWESLMEIQRVYGDFNKVGRIEVVLSNWNLYHLPELLEYLYENNIKRIGISYPHLDGFAYRVSFDKAREIGFSYRELKNVLPKVYRLAQKYPDIMLDFEEVPPCMWRDENGTLLDGLPNIGDMTHKMDEEIYVKYPNYDLDTNFKNSFVSMHKQSNKCGKCVFCCMCVGVWSEAIDIFGDEGFEPITDEESTRLSK